MKFLVSLIILTVLQSCTQKYQPIKTSSMENTEAKNNPYYSRTDTTKLNISNEEWKKFLLRIFMQYPEKQLQKELLPENTMNLMRWGLLLCCLRKSSVPLYFKICKQLWLAEFL